MSTNPQIRLHCICGVGSKPLRNTVANNIDDLIRKAEEWVSIGRLRKQLYRLRNNSLNKFISYHLIEKIINSNQFFISTSMAKNVEMYEFLETMYTNRIMKVSNKRLTSGMSAMLNPDSEDELYVTNRTKTTVNGVLHHLNEILLYTNNGI